MKTRNWANALLLASALTLFGCAHTSPPVTTFGHCVSDSVTKASRGVLGHVMTALAQGDYVAELAELATQVGGDVVGCAVDLAIEELGGMFRASRDPIAGQMLARAQAWRGARP